MKTFKLTAALFLAATIILGFSSCKKCNGEDPAARIVNEGSEKASVQIKTSGGNTENINNIEPGTSSAYVSYAPGEVVFTATVDSVLFVDTVFMSECFDYDIIINENNTISATAVDRND
ncbi:MAG: hypothetical protein A2W93_13440 [Bacteroidetes bacterium GWF2_43_63]|nr:MAG: hypothetical protein A2W94_03635 [Bacteroidetes bacterium GWE2_42_42]OFY54994.1 MAG: hypothetical protein A2W93_13440 [Bacteroidetes bacterium GWF2_43_63]HBG69527.1 hypothetical protein [Bacteroidales bacterium]HCB60734.1 hypothetical protein [Bacteroidales bacterium]HCY23962.1 hypothetical protein [Bacteroidales bacterium]